jgi:hypothetical protein
MNKKLLVALIFLTLALSSCSALPNVLNITKGSGNVISESRDISGVTSVDLDGSADVDIAFGESESLVIEAEDNIIPLIETKVENGKLTVGTRSNTSYTSTKGIKVHVTLISLEAVSLSGSGNITIHNLQGDTLKAELDGSGNINLNGTVNSVEMSLGGSGKINAEQLKADSVKVVVDGSGDARVYASEQLNADLSGSGSIRYSGNPANVNKNDSGSGSITGE